MVVGSNGQDRRKVTIGESDDNFVVIKSGLAEGERVLLNPGVLIPDKEKAAPETKPQEGPEYATPAPNVAQPDTGEAATPRANGVPRTDATKADARKSDGAGKGQDGAPRRPRGGDRRGPRPDGAQPPPNGAQPSPAAAEKAP